MNLKDDWKVSFILLVIFSLAAFIRFYNFSNRINFGPEQAISLIVSGDYIKDKFTLLGDPNLQRVTSSGLIIFHLPIFNYSLVPLLLIFNYDPLPITFYFGLLNIFTGLILYLVVKKIFDFKIAIFSTFLFLFNNVMIYYSLFIWNQHYIPLLSVLSIWLIYQLKQKTTDVNPWMNALCNTALAVKLHRIRKNYEKQNIMYGLLLGFTSGLIFGVQYLYIIFIIGILGLLIFLSKYKVITFLSFIFGLMLALIPMVLFDLKHDFYYSRTLIQYFWDTFYNTEQSKINYYHFLSLWPVFVIGGGWLMTKIFQKNKYLAIFFCLIYLYFNLSSSLVNFNEAVGMNKGLNYPILDIVASRIAEERPSKFNIATTWDFDSRAHPLRYLLKYRYQTIPAGVEEYKNIDNIYVMTNPEYNFEKTTLYEISEFRPFGVELLVKISNDYSVFKLKPL